MNNMVLEDNKIVECPANSPDCKPLIIGVPFISVQQMYYLPSNLQQRRPWWIPEVPFNTMIEL